MAQDKVLARLEAKIDALLEKAGIKPEDVQVTADKSETPELDEAQKAAIANAPKTPIASSTAPAASQQAQQSGGEAEQPAGGEENAPKTPAADEENGSPAVPRRRG